MDFGKYPHAHMYEDHTRPNYPTPPPSFSQPTDDYSSFHEAFQFPPVSPAVSSKESSDSVEQTPLIFDSLSLSLSSSPLAANLGFSVASLSMDPLQTIIPDADDDETVVSISTSFNLNTEPTPDTIFSSADGVLFYVHCKTIMETCPTAFISILGDPLSHPKFRNGNISLDIPSPELNVIFHALYGTSPAANRPPVYTLVQAVDSMPAYSLSPKVLVRPSGSLYELLLYHAPLHPLETYALAAHHDLHSLAVNVSSHLLSHDLSTLSDDTAERIGAIYLKKLMVLHMGRFTALKSILLHPPHPHPPSKQCGFEDQRKLTRAWALVSAYLAWDARPDLSTHGMYSALNPLMEHLTCTLCHQALENKIKDVVVQWASVKHAAVGQKFG